MALFLSPGSRARVQPQLNFAVPNGLVGYWGFDADCLDFNAGLAYDLSGTGNTGMLVGMSTSSSPTAGKIGGALEFNGSSSYVSIGNTSSLSITSSLTLAAWVYLNAGFSNGYESIVGKWGNPPRSYLLSFGSSGVSRNNVVFWLDNGSTVSGLNGSAAQSTFVGGWHHIVGVYNSAAQTQSLYIDGKLDTSTSYSGTLTSNSLNVEIGNHNLNDSYFNGKVDDVRIYNRALSPIEVLTLYYAGLSGRRTRRGHKIGNLIHPLALVRPRLGLGTHG